jgi:hypothetical protein
VEIPRKDRTLDEAIRVLDGRLDEAEGDINHAYMLLSKYELAFIDEEIAKCLNFRYYAENYHVINSKHKGIITLFPFFESQEIFYEKIVEIQASGKPVQVIVLKARQLGLSTINEALILHKTVFNEACNSLIVAQDPSQADYLFNMSRMAYDSLPWWMRPEARYESKGRYLEFDRRDDMMRMTKPGLRSMILVEAANKMSGVGVGKAFKAAHLSELSLWPAAKALSEQLFPALSNTPDQIAVMESTARGRDNFWYDIWKDSWEGRVPWTPIFIEFFRLKQYSIPVTAGAKFVREKEEDALANKVLETTGIELTDGQLNWRRTQMQLSRTLNRGDDSSFYQEYPGSSWMEAFQGSGICAFNKRKLQLILESTCAPPTSYGEIELTQDKAGKWTAKTHLTKLTKGTKAPPQEQHGSRLYVWEPPEEGRSYYIGADVAHGIYGGDYSCAQVLKIGYGAQPDIQVAEWHGWINPTPYGDAVCALGYWYNTAQIAIECNDVGQSTNARVMRVLEYPNLFRWKHYDKIKNFMTDFFGWYTNVKTRDLIIAKFREFIDDDMIIIRSEGLIDECFDFSSVDDSRFEGQSTKDDRVFSIMIAIFCAHDAEGWGNEQAMKKPPKKDFPKGVDFINTDYSFMEDPNKESKAHPNDNELPAEVAMHEEIYAGGDNEAWKTY